MLAGCTARAQGPEMTVWIMRPGNIAGASAFCAAQTGAFERAHRGVHVAVQYVPWLSAHDKLVASLAGDVAPDVSELGNTWTPEFAAAGALLPVDDVTATRGGAAAFVPALLASARLPDGKTYGVPWYAGVRALLYRKSYFAAARLQPPATLAELQRDAQLLTDPTRGRYGFALMGNNAPLFYPIVWEFGGEFARVREGTWHSALAETSAAERALAYVDRLYRAGVAPRSAIIWSDLDGRTAFGQGSVAMTITGTWSLPGIYAAHPEIRGDVGVAPYPAARPGAPSLPFVGGSHLAVFRSSRSAALAKAFVAQLLGDEAQRAWAQTVGFYPAVSALGAGTIPGGTTPAQSRIFAAGLRSGKSGPPAPGWGAVEGAQTIPGMVQAVLSGAASEQHAVAQATRELDELLARGE